jgi:D-sedoheptulose 7-phosphate isomerase
MKITAKSWTKDAARAAARNAPRAVDAVEAVDAVDAAERADGDGRAGGGAAAPRGTPDRAVEVDGAAGAPGGDGAAGAAGGSAGRAGTGAVDGADRSGATGIRHCDDLMAALAGFQASCPTVHRWGGELARRLGGGARLLVAGNGGSAAQAQHLTAELVGRYRDDRPPYSALALHADTSSTTAIANDYGVQEVFARQTSAHGRPGDILMLLSTSGASANLLAAAGAAHSAGMDVWALTGPAPNPLAAAADEVVCADARETATVQELHLVAVHMMCEAFDHAVAERAGAEAEAAGSSAAGARAAGARAAGAERVGGGRSAGGRGKRGRV